MLKRTAGRMEVAVARLAYSLPQPHSFLQGSSKPGPTSSSLDAFEKLR